VDILKVLFLFKKNKKTTTIFANCQLVAGVIEGGSFTESILIGQISDSLLLEIVEIHAYGIFLQNGNLKMSPQAHLFQ